MPRRLWTPVKKTYIFTPKYKRESWIECQKKSIVIKVVDAHIHNYLNEMYDVFDNLMELSLHEVEDCLDVPKKIRKKVIHKTK